MKEFKLISMTQNPLIVFIALNLAQLDSTAVIVVGTDTDLLVMLVPGSSWIKHILQHEHAVYLMRRVSK